MTKPKAPRIALVGDAHGIDALLAACPPELISVIVGASIRPNYHQQLRVVAERLSVPMIIQPKYGSAEYAGFVARFGELQISHLVCYSYSMVLRPDFLKLVEFNAVNFHSALLPRNRGANPAQWAIIKGEENTGVTMHFMDAGIDSGDIVAQEVVKITLEDTWVSLAARLHQAAMKVMREHIPSFLGGTARRVAQTEALATHNPRLTPDTPEIRFDLQSDLEIYNLIRAQVAPLQGAFLRTPQEILRISRPLAFGEIESLRNQYGSQWRGNPA